MERQRTREEETENNAKRKHIKNRIVKRKEEDKGGEIQRESKDQVEIRETKLYE